jgi:DNA primase
MSDRPFISFVEVKEKVPIPDALAALGILDRFHQHGEKLSGVCPSKGHAHGPRPNPQQWKANKNGQGLWLWHCFGCKAGGDVVELVKQVTGYDNSHVRFFFHDHFKERLSCTRKNGSTPVEKDTAREASARDTAQAAPNSTSNLPSELPAIKPLRFRLNLDGNVPYLRERGVRPETIERYGIGLCSRGLLKGYVAMPVFGEVDGDSPIAYIGRWPGSDFDETKGRPRYKFPDEFPRNRVLYGYSVAARSPIASPIVVVEGPFSVFHLAQCGVTNVVATLGSSLSDEQAILLARLRRPVVIIFDGDDAGRRGAQAAIEKLAPLAFVRSIALVDGHQPTDLSTENVRGLMA